MSCTSVVSKTWMIVINILFFFIAGIGIALGGGCFYFAEDLLKIEILRYTVIALMAISGFILLLTFFGCCGSITENSCMVITFMVILIGTILFEMGVGAFVAIKKSYIEDKIVDVFKKNEISYGNHSTFWDFWQTHLACCGFNDSNDWKGPTLPKSCCAVDLNTCTQTDPTFHKHGCDFEFREFFNGLFSNMVFIIILIVIFAVQIMGVVFSCIFYYRLKDYSKIYMPR